MQVCPCAGGCRITCGSLSLYETGNNTHRHLLGAGSVAAIQDSFVKCEADCLTESGKQFGGEVNVGIFQICVADREEAADLEAVHLEVVESECQLVEICAAVSPDRFRNGAHNKLSCCAANRTDGNVLVQLGVNDDILTEQSEHNLRDCQADIGDGSLLGHAGADFGQPCLHVLALDKSGALLCGHSVKDDIFSHCCSYLLCRDFRSRCFRSGVCVLCAFLCGKLFLKVADCSLEAFLLGFVRGLVGLVSSYSFLDCGLLFFCFSFLDACCDFGLAGCKFRVLRSQRVECFLCITQFLSEHQGFQGHGVTSFSWFPAMLRVVSCGFLRVHVSAPQRLSLHMRGKQREKPRKAGQHA